MENQIVYTDDSGFKFKGMIWRLGAIPIRKLLEIYRNHKSGKKTPDPAFISYIESSFDKLKARAEATGNKGLINHLNELIAASSIVTKTIVSNGIPEQENFASKKEQYSQVCTSGKMIYITEREAREALHSIRSKKQKHKKPIRCYQCDECSWWHHTSLSIDAWRKKSKH